MGNTNYKTEQESFWAGHFGDEYIKRNQEHRTVASNRSFFSEIFQHTGNISSVVEFGSNIGMNLIAIQSLLPNAKLSAIEINQTAVAKLSENINNIEIYNTSILDYSPRNLYDFVLIKGVLIHINPTELKAVYERLYKSTSRYICVAEYYNPSPVTVSYRGHENRLFKRDFAGEMLDLYSNLHLVKYGFVYHRDNNFPQDDITWFLLEKNS